MDVRADARADEGTYLTDGSFPCAISGIGGRFTPRGFNTPSLNSAQNEFHRAAIAAR